MTLVLERGRSAWQNGDPITSRKLKLPTLAWIGMDRSNADAARELGIPYNHFADWLGSDSRQLDETYQKQLMVHPGIMEKYKMLERRGLL